MVEHKYKNIYSLFIPLPGNPLKWLNSYVIKANGGKNLLIDTGFNRADCLSSLLLGMKELDIRPNETDVFLTHCHADHSGNARALQDMGCRIIMSELDYSALQQDPWQSRQKWMAAEGMPLEVFELVHASNPAVQYVSAHFDSDFVYDEQLLDYGGMRLRCLHTPGHSKGHMCLYCEEERLLFSGDHILFDITPNICSYGAGTNALGEYLDSLLRIKSIGAEVVLPSHRGQGHDSLAQRVDRLISHHLSRLGELEGILTKEPGQNAYRLTAQMQWKISARNWAEFPPGQKWFAVCEALAHIDLLLAQGRLTRQLGSDGVFTYSLK